MKRRAAAAAVEHVTTAARVKELLAELDAVVTDTGTSSVTLLVPAGYDLPTISRAMASEAAVAGNIRSRV